MNVHRTLLLFSLLALPVLGCGESNARFTLSEETGGLMDEAQQGMTLQTEQGRVEIPGVADYVRNSFGTPQNLVAWLKLPVDYGRLAGAVGEQAIGVSADSFQILVDAEDEVLRRLEETELRGLAVHWLSGPYQGARLEPKEPGTGTAEAAVFRVGGYDPANRALSVRMANFDPAEESLVLGDSTQLAEAAPGTLPPPKTGARFAVIGHTLRRGHDLYMQHCMHCHGVTGDGNGPTAPYLNPNPRDYRNGVFKFTSTGQNEKARRADLIRTVKHGIPGTYMPSFMLLPDDEVEAIVEYVRWLAMRGEFEQRLAQELSGDYSREAVRLQVEQARAQAREDGRDPDKAAAETHSEIQQLLADTLQNYFPDSVDFAADQVATAWQRAEDPQNIVRPVKTVQRSPDEGSPQGRVTARWSREDRRWRVLKKDNGQQEGSPVSGLDLDDVGRFEGNQLARILKQNENLAGYRIQVDVEVPRVPDTPESRARGRALFLSGRAKCASCHGATARGNGPQTLAFQKKPGSGETYPEPGLYDAWDNPIEPRDLTRGLYRGGRRPIDLYRRIHTGIKGTPMPPFGGVLKPEEIWDLVNYVYSIPYETPEYEPLPESKELASASSESAGG